MDSTVRNPAVPWIIVGVLSGLIIGLFAAPAVWGGMSGGMDMMGGSGMMGDDMSGHMEQMLELCEEHMEAHHRDADAESADPTPGNGTS